MRIVHEKIKPFNCQECGKNFGQKVNLIGHIQSRHKSLDGVDQIKNTPTTSSETSGPAIEIENTQTSQENTHNAIISTSGVGASHVVLDQNHSEKTNINSNKKGKVFKCMECVFDSEDSGDMISHHLSTHVQTMFNFDTSELLLE